MLYGARYLDPTGAMWLSVDPMWEKYAGMSPYNYCAGNPVKLVDPDGRKVRNKDQEEFLTYEKDVLIFEKNCPDLKLKDTDNEKYKQVNKNVRNQYESKKAMYNRLNIWKEKSALRIEQFKTLMPEEFELLDNLPFDVFVTCNYQKYRNDGREYKYGAYTGFDDIGSGFVTIHLDPSFISLDPKRSYDNGDRLPHEGGHIYSFFLNKELYYKTNDPNGDCQEISRTRTNLPYAVEKAIEWQNKFQLKSFDLRNQGK